MSTERVFILLLAAIASVALFRGEAMEGRVEELEESEIEDLERNTELTEAMTEAIKIVGELVEDVNALEEKAP